MPTIEEQISAADIEQVVERARQLPADLHGDVVMGEGNTEYYRFSSGLADFHAPNKDFTKAIIKQMYGDDNDVLVLRLGIIAVPTLGRNAKQIHADFTKRLDTINAEKIASHLNILHNVKQPVYEESQQKNKEDNRFRRFNPFLSDNKESRITAEERKILEDIADIIASDGKYTQEEEYIMAAIRQLLIEEDITKDDVSNEKSQIGKLVAELRAMNQG